MSKDQSEHFAQQVRFCESRLTRDSMYWATEFTDFVYESLRSVLEVVHKLNDWLSSQRDFPISAQHVINDILIETLFRLFAQCAREKTLHADSLRYLQELLFVVPTAMDRRIEEICDDTVLVNNLENAGVIFVQDLTKSNSLFCGMIAFDEFHPIIYRWINETRNQGQKSPIYMLDSGSLRILDHLKLEGNSPSRTVGLFKRTKYRDANALCVLGEQAFNGRYIVSDDPHYTGLAMLRAAGHQLNQNACVLLVRILRNEEALRVHDDEVSFWQQRAEILGSRAFIVEAAKTKREKRQEKFDEECRVLADIKPVKECPPMIIHLIRRAKLRDTDALYEVAKHAWRGNYVSSNDSRRAAIVMLRLAARLGNSRAHDLIGHLGAENADFQRFRDDLSFWPQQDSDLNGGATDFHQNHDFEPCNTESFCATEQPPLLPAVDHVLSKQIQRTVNVSEKGFGAYKPRLKNILVEFRELYPLAVSGGRKTLKEIANSEQPDSHSLSFRERAELVELYRAKDGGLVIDQVPVAVYLIAVFFRKILKHTIEFCSAGLSFEDLFQEGVSEFFQTISLSTQRTPFEQTFFVHNLPRLYREMLLSRHGITWTATESTYLADPHFSSLTNKVPLQDSHDHRALLPDVSCCTELFDPQLDFTDFSKIIENNRAKRRFPYTNDELLLLYSMIHIKSLEQLKFRDYIEDEEAQNPSFRVAQSLLLDDIIEVMASLSIREREVLKLRLGFCDGEQRRLEEVGIVFGVDREHIRQIETRAYRKLRQPNLSRRLREYID